MPDDQDGDLKIPPRHASYRVMKRCTNCHTMTVYLEHGVIKLTSVAKDLKSNLCVDCQKK